MTTQMTLAVPPRPTAALISGTLHLLLFLLFGWYQFTGAMPQVLEHVPPAAPAPELVFDPSDNAVPESPVTGALAGVADNTIPGAGPAELVEAESELSMILGSAWTHTA